MKYYVLKDDRKEMSVRSIFELKRMHELGEIDGSDVVRREGKSGWATVDERLGLRQVFDPVEQTRRKKKIPPPPPVSWWLTIILGAITLGYAGYIVGFIQAIWSRKIERRFSPVALASVALMIPPTHLVWIVRSLAHGRHHFREAALEVVIGIVVAEVAAAVFTALSSLSVRKTLMRAQEEFGFRMSKVLTILFGPVYVAFTLETLWSSYHG